MQNRGIKVNKQLDVHGENFLPWKYDSRGTTLYFEEF